LGLVKPGSRHNLLSEIVLSKKGFTMLKMTFWQHFDGMICLVYAKKQEENTGMNAPIDDTMC
jgi:hypothetical protein